MLLLQCFGTATAIVLWLIANFSAFNLFGSFNDNVKVERASLADARGCGIDRALTSLNDLLDYGQSKADPCVVHRRRPLQFSKLAKKHRQVTLCYPSASVSYAYKQLVALEVVVSMDHYLAKARELYRIPHQVYQHLL